MKRPFASAACGLCAMLAAIPLVLGLALGGGKAYAAEPKSSPSPGTIDAIMANMSLDDKISQLIIPAMRTWNGQAVTDLSAVPELAQALRKHQYGGIILYGSNIVGAEQTRNLVAALQQNNAAGEFQAKIPYLMPVDEEGGVVLRFTMGTRMSGNMALGATGAKAPDNARTTGHVLGEEMNALGFNADFAPDVDVNSNPANPVIGVRSFGDDPSAVGQLGEAFASGLTDKGVVPTYKHFPGHGDTGTDSHIGTASVDKTYEQLKATELVPFQKVIDGGADLIMTAHVTLPKYDDEVTFADGSKGFFPATMSKKVITELLRKEMGFDGVVVTDALEMGAIGSVPLVPGAPGSAEYGANIAEKCLLAGDDILLLPHDMTGEDAVSYYDEYIGRLKEKVESNAQLRARVDQSVRRVLTLKAKYGILETPAPAYDISVVGSKEHHEAEAKIAAQAITLLKNDGLTLPAAGHDKNIVLLGRDKSDNVALAAVVEKLQAEGLLPEDAYVNNLAAGTSSGSPESKTTVTIDFYYDAADGLAPHYTEDLKAAIAKADTVVALTKCSGITSLQPANPQYRGIAQTLADTHAAGGKYILISGNLPYDAARFQDADAIICAYMSSATNMDPTARGEAPVGAYNANVPAAIGAVFDEIQPAGTLPVNIPSIIEEDGHASYDLDNILYPRGTGLHYAYAFTAGEGGSYDVGSGQDLAFATNARYDRLTSVSVDGVRLADGQYTVGKGHTALSLAAAYLDTLAPGEHSLALAYGYGYDEGGFELRTTFTVVGKDDPTPGGDPSGDPTPGPVPGGDAKPDGVPSGSATVAPAPGTTPYAGPTKPLASTGAELAAVLAGVVLAVFGGLMFAFRKGKGVDGARA